MSRDESDESEASSVCSERSFDSFRRNDVRKSVIFFSGFVPRNAKRLIAIFFSLVRGMVHVIDWIAPRLLQTSIQLFIFVHQRTGLKEKTALQA